VANGRTIRISAAGISASGKAFANSSSLSLKWELGSCEGLAQWDHAFNIVKSSDWERFLVLQNESGLVLRDLIPNNHHFIYYLTFSPNFTVSGILVVFENLLSQIVVYFYFPL
jgi:hypothetical protein